MRVLYRRYTFPKEIRHLSLADCLRACVFKAMLGRKDYRALDMTFTFLAGLIDRDTCFTADLVMSRGHTT